MQFEEAAVWLTGVLPGSVQLRSDSPAHRPSFHVAETQTDAGHALSCTVDFHRIDTGVAFREYTVRSELLCVTKAEQHLATQVVRGTGRHLANLQGLIPAQPGTFVEKLGDVLKLPSEVTTRDAILTGPVLWDGQTPQYLEPEQLTLLLQVILLTRDELNFGKTYGAAALLQQMAAEEVDYLDWYRG